MPGDAMTHQRSRMSLCFKKRHCGSAIFAQLCVDLRELELIVEDCTRATLNSRSSSA